MKSSLTIGNFDGVHLGHQELIRHVLDFSRRDGCEATLLTFEPHPREFLGIRPIPPRLCGLREKIRRIESLGLKKIVVQAFDKDFANLSAADFLSTLRERFDPAHVVVGTNFFFGKNRGGDPNYLLAWGKREKIKVDIFEPLKIDDVVISSSEVRRAIQEGQLSKAKKLMGFAHCLELDVVSGDHRGRALGFPTLNSTVPHPDREGVAAYCLPPHGVYITKVKVEGKIFPSVTNFGIRPTFHTSQAGEFFETHVLDPQFDRLSCEHIVVDFLDRIRPELRFSSSEELIQRIQQDILISKAFHGL